VGGELVCCDREMGCLSDECGGVRVERMGNEGWRDADHGVGERVGRGTLFALESHLFSFHVTIT